MRTVLLYKYIIKSFRILTFFGIILTLGLLYYRLAPETGDTENPSEPQKNVDETAGKDLANYEITLENSVFKGVNKDQQLYMIAAEKAIKDKDNKYKLSKINGKYELDDYRDLLINARNGIIDRDSQFIYLSDTVELLLNGLIFETNSMRFDLQNKQAGTDSKVKVTYKHSNIAADSFNTSGEGSVLNFDGHVTTKINISDF